MSTRESRKAPRGESKSCTGRERADASATAGMRRRSVSAADVAVHVALVSTTSGRLSAVSRLPNVRDEYPRYATYCKQNHQALSPHHAREARTAPIGRE
jgi:hypothetical protein